MKTNDKQTGFYLDDLKISVWYNKIAELKSDRARDRSSQTISCILYKLVRKTNMKLKL